MPVVSALSSHQPPSSSKSLTMPDQPDSPPPPSPSLPPLTNHCCFLIYPLSDCNFPPRTDLTLGDLADAQRTAAKTPKGKPWLADDALAGISDKRRRLPLWEPGSLKPGNDFFPYIRRLLGEETSPSAAPEQALDPHTVVYRWSESLCKLVQGKRLAYPRDTPAEQRRPRQLMLQLTPSARKRIIGRLPSWTGDTLQVEILDLHQIVFRTRHGFLVAKIRLAAPSMEGLHPALLVEGLCSLCRINDLSWQPAADAALPPTLALAPAQAPEPTAESAPTKTRSSQDRFTLGSLIHGLNCKPGKGGKAKRVFSTSYIEFRQRPDPEALDQLLTRLARHYSDDYLLPDIHDGSVDVTHFENVSHRFALEGCATAVDLSAYAPGDPPDFLDHYLDTTYRGHYLPIILLAYHEFCVLLHLTNDASFWPRQGDEKASIERMQQIRQDVTAFMLCFRFSFVSRIGMHNETNQALRKVFGLDWMLDELNNDSARIDGYMASVAAKQQQQQAEQQARRFRWASVIGVLGVTWLSLFSGLKEVLAIDAIARFLCIPSGQSGVYAVIIALLLAGVAAWVTYRRDGT